MRRCEEISRGSPHFTARGWQSFAAFETFEAFEAFAAFETFEAFETFDAFETSEALMASVSFETFEHDTFRGPNFRLSINSSRPPHLRVKVPEKYVTGDPFGVPLSDTKVNALLRKYAGDFKKTEAHDQICLSDDDDGNDGGARGFSAGAGATTNREVIMDANTHSKSMGLAQKLQRERNEVALRGYAEDMRQLATGADADTAETLLDICKKRPRGDSASLEEMRKQAMPQR